MKAEMFRRVIRENVSLRPLSLLFETSLLRLFIYLFFSSFRLSVVCTLCIVRSVRSSCSKDALLQAGSRLSKAFFV